MIFAQKLSQSSKFQSFVTGVIVFAGVLVGVETDAAIVARYGGILHVLDQLVLGVFLVEIAVKVAAEGRKPWRYFGDAWNVFDFLIVAASFLPFAGQHVVVLRLARLFRVLRLVRALPKLQILVAALLKSIPSMGYVSLLLGLIFYMYAVAGTFLFGGNDPVYFGTLPRSFLSLFRVVTLEGWTELLYTAMQGCDRYGYDAMAALCTQPLAQPAVAVTYYVSFILLATMIILNLFIGVIMNGMQEAHNEEEKRAARERHSAAAELVEVESTLRELQARIARLRREGTLEIEEPQRKAG